MIHTDGVYSRVGRTTDLYVAVSIYVCFPHGVVFNAFMICVYLLLCWLRVCVVYRFGVKT